MYMYVLVCIILQNLNTLSIFVSSHYNKLDFRKSECQALDFSLITYYFEKTSGSMCVKWYSVCERTVWRQTVVQIMSCATDAAVAGYFVTLVIHEMAI